MKWARVINGFVVETTDVDPAGRFHPDLIWVECPDETEQHWSYDGAQFVAPPPPPEPEPEPEEPTD